MRGFIMTVLLGLTVDVTSGMDRIQLIPQYPVINGSVTLSVTGITEDIVIIIWYKGPKTDPQYQILTYIPGSDDPLSPGPLYNPRITAFNNGSLQIKDLHITDGGNFIVKIYTVKSLQDINVTLTVYVPQNLTVDVTSGMGRIQLIHQHPVITLSVTGITEDIVIITWYKGPNTDPQYQILTYIPGDDPLLPGPLYNPRFLAFNNGSLQIRDLHITDGGDYIVKIQTNKKQEDIHMTLTVYEPVTKPKISASTNKPKENDAFTLTCDTSKATKITWTKSGASISSEAKPSGDNKTLTFSSIKRGDAGEYKCEAQNLASTNTSDPYTVTVAFPQNLTVVGTSRMDRIQLIPQYPFINGSVILSVTGITEDIVFIIWYKGPKTEPQYQILTYIPGSDNPLLPGPLYNPRFLAFNNGSLQIKDLHITDGGDYKVKIQTNKKQKVIHMTLTVYESVTKPKISASTNKPKENDTFTLTCDTSNATKRTWTKSGTSISSEAKLSEDNKTLTFSSIKREDAGEYKCEAQNLVSTATSDLYLVTVA